MDDKRGRGRPKAEKPAKKISVSIFPDQLEWAKTIAREKHGKNLSLFIQTLIDKERQAA
jgi:hypothetical protein